MNFDGMWFGIVVQAGLGNVVCDEKEWKWGLLKKTSGSTVGMMTNFPSYS